MELTCWTCGKEAVCQCSECGDPVCKDHCIHLNRYSHLPDVNLCDDCALLYVAECEGFDVKSWK